MDVITVVHISYMYFSKVAFLESIFFIDLCLFVFIFFLPKHLICMGVYHFWLV